ncbi:excisionase family DNA binding protein [Sphingomonas sp. PP-F2F-G114-C0414]|uniref:excisionase family DNA-binding protein n=1 Tax=Sphingomonas sp. PP-F2F-G114-C0414 TaxID=2135662 RepID=UPI000F2B4B6F|nr:helix-turn-helix domain-containing protein [Sphingomonas sp. PP-F2F-G114-C0414]RMB36600.1 excisionase family DNA binding protein [Sphingomonas sp. PP-F2F-G114-C0414]
MTAVAVKLDELHEPSVEDIDAARTAARQLSRFNKGKPVSFTLDRAGDDADHADAEEPISLPANIFRVLVNMLVEMGNGNAVAVVPVSAELTTQQAADLLNVSRPHVIKLIDAGKIHSRMVGTHRKLRAQDVLSFRDRTDYERRIALSAMVASDEELGLYDDEPVGMKDG